MEELLWSKCMKGPFGKSQGGQTLIEALVALGAAVIIVSAITIVVISALNNAQFSKNQNLATQFAQQGMEIMRQMRDSNWTTFSDLSEEAYCLDKGSNIPVLKDLTIIAGCGHSGQSGQNVDLFAREVDIEGGNSPDCASATKVTVVVSWNDAKCTNSTNLFCHKVELVSCFSDSRVVPTP